MFSVMLAPETERLVSLDWELFATIDAFFYVVHSSSKIIMAIPPRQNPANTRHACCVYVDVSLMPKNNERQNDRVNPMQ
jgi:hypothetical protein